MQKTSFQATDATTQSLNQEENGKKSKNITTGRKQNQSMKCKSNQENTNSKTCLKP
jgi:hypothetical protein